jgi:hypothetical protein
MNNLAYTDKEKSITQKTTNSEESKANTRPSPNGFYQIIFDEKNRQEGFTVLLNGGTFNGISEGFIVSKKHIELLKKARIPFTTVS